MTIEERKNEWNHMEASGLTWRGLAARLGRGEHRGLELRLPAGPGRRMAVGEKDNPDSAGPGD